MSSGVFPNVFAHYQQFGESENRAPTVAFETFDAADIEKRGRGCCCYSGSVLAALDHFIAFGQNESRAAAQVYQTQALMHLRQLQLWKLDLTRLLERLKTTAFSAPLLPLPTLPR